MDALGVDPWEEWVEIKGEVGAVTGIQWLTKIMHMHFWHKNKCTIT